MSNMYVCFIQIQVEPVYLICERKFEKEII